MSHDFSFASNILSFVQVAFFSWVLSAWKKPLYFSLQWKYYHVASNYIKTAVRFNCKNQWTTVSLHTTTCEQCFWSQISHMEVERQRENVDGGNKREEQKFSTHSCRSFLNSGVELTQQHIWPPHSCVFEKRILPTAATTRWTSSLHLTGEWRTQPVRGQRVIWCAWGEQTDAVYVTQWQSTKQLQ